MNPAANIGKILGLGFLPAAYVVMLLVMFLLPLASVEEYSILRNTTSHLGAQGAPYAWIMNGVFLALGIASIIEAWRHLSKFWLHKVLLTLFGISLVLTAFFQHAPIIAGAAFNPVEDEWHSKFATTTGFSFTFFAMAAAFIESNLRRRMIAAGMAVLSTVLSYLIFHTPSLAGIWQRLIFITAFAWLMFFLYRSASPK